MYTLYSYYRSSCSWRCRLALELKSLPYTLHQINLLKDDQSSEEYLKINPSGIVPALIVQSTGQIICQSVAILEYLEEVHGENSSIFNLLPSCLIERALTRQLVQIIASDCQPLQNLHVLRHLQQITPLSEDQSRQLWGRHYIQRALQAYTRVLQSKKTTTTRFSLGESVTLADLCLIPQLYNARRFGIKIEEEFPLLHSIELAFQETHSEAYSRAHPDNSQ